MVVECIRIVLPHHLIISFLESFRFDPCGRYVHVKLPPIEVKCMQFSYHTKQKTVNQRLREGTSLLEVHTAFLLVTCAQPFMIYYQMQSPFINCYARSEAENCLCMEN